MKKIIITICLLILGIVAVTWLYFKNLSGSENSSERAFYVIPENASLVFEYKNEASFYDIFKDFGLFKDILGDKSISHLDALKKIFIDNPSVAPAFNKSDLFFSLHPTTKNTANILIVAPFSKDYNLSEADFLKILTSKYKVAKDSAQKMETYHIAFSNHANFYFILHHNLLIGSFEESLVKTSRDLILSRQEKNHFRTDFNNPRNRNSIANLYINFSKVPGLLNNFSSRKNPIETFALKAIDACATLNINYQNNAFMFSGITEANLKAKNYFNLFLSQKPGNSTLKNMVPYDAANYSFFYVSDFKQFRKGLDELFAKRNESAKLKAQLDNITKKHSINIEDELIPVIGPEFGVLQLASGDKIGIVKSNNINRLSFLMSTISSPTTDKIRHLDDSYLFYYFMGDPFNFFRRPYYAVVENHLIIANNTVALKHFLQNYNSQNFLIRTDKNLDFQQYLTNQGNIFYFIHNSNSKAIIRSFLNNSAYNSFKSNHFNWSEIYGLAIQFSADKDRFFTNLYMSKLPEQEDLLPKVDSVLLDSLTQ